MWVSLHLGTKEIPFATERLAMSQDLSTLIQSHSLSPWLAGNTSSLTKPDDCNCPGPEGSQDLVAVPVPWAGHDRNLVRITSMPQWQAVVGNDTLVQLAVESLPEEFHNLTRDDVLLLADVRQGGELLAEFLPNLTGIAGFPDRMGRMTGISAGTLIACTR